MVDAGLARHACTAPCTLCTKRVSWYTHVRRPVVEVAQEVLQHQRELLRHRVVDLCTSALGLMRICKQSGTVRCLSERPPTEWCCKCLFSACEPALAPRMSR